MWKHENALFITKKYESLDILLGLNFELHDGAVTFEL